MEVVEVPAICVSLLSMLASVGVKVSIAQMISRMTDEISNVGRIKQEALGRLKFVQNQRAVAEQNKGSLTTKRTKIAKRLSRIKKESSTLQQDEEKRKQRTGIRKVE
ncbi:MAG: hypothetical protein ACKVJG_26545 [Candidatus Latescibacterota bacterium]|jgi:hypothetical protein